MALPGSANRKRSRNNFDDEVSEFTTPLSKRIKNLHLNNSINPLTKQLNDNETKAGMHRDIVVNNERLSELKYEGSRDMDKESRFNQQHQEQHWLQHYSPDLSPTQNPYYYESNRLLFELYLQRSQRSNPSTSQNHHY